MASLCTESIGKDTYSQKLVEISGVCRRAGSDRNMYANAATRESGSELVAGMDWSVSADREPEQTAECANRPTVPDDGKGRVPLLSAKRTGECRDVS